MMLALHRNETASSVQATTGRACRPAVGERAAGYGVCGAVAAVADRQPLRAEGIWLVTLAGERVGRLVQRDEQDYASGAAGWRLLQVDDMTDEQLDLYGMGMAEAA